MGVWGRRRAEACRSLAWRARVASSQLWGETGQPVRHPRKQEKTAPHAALSRGPGCCGHLALPRCLGGLLLPVPVSKGIGSRWPNSTYPFSPHPLLQTMTETMGRELWISVWVMSLCSRVGMGGWVGRRRDVDGEPPSQMEYRYNISLCFHTPGESVCICSGGRGRKSMPGT